MIFRKHIDHGCYYCGRAPHIHANFCEHDDRAIYVARCPKGHMMSEWNHSPDEASRYWFDLVDYMSRTRDEGEQ